jgi:hypothetical protein
VLMVLHPVAIVASSMFVTIERPRGLPSHRMRACELCLCAMYWPQQHHGVALAGCNTQHRVKSARITTLSSSK